MNIWQLTIKLVIQTSDTNQYTKEEKKKIEEYFVKLTVHNFVLQEFYFFSCKKF